MVKNGPNCGTFTSTLCIQNPYYRRVFLSHKIRPLSEITYSTNIWKNWSSKNWTSDPHTRMTEESRLSGAVPHAIQCERRALGVQIISIQHFPNGQSMNHNYQPHFNILRTENFWQTAQHSIRFLSVVLSFMQPIVLHVNLVPTRDSISVISSRNPIFLFQPISNISDIFNVKMLFLYAEPFKQ